nr:hypothetical protein CFP56_75810 [Quercus suber]
MPVDRTWGIMPLFAQDSPKVSLEQWSFLDKIFRIKLVERTWQKLVTLDTIHWYYEGPKPTVATFYYDEQARRQIEDGKEGRTSVSRLLHGRRSKRRRACPRKVVTRSTAEETPDPNKLPPLPRPRKEKGLMTG